MNFDKTKKISFLRRIKRELEEKLPEIDDYDPEVGSDLKWSLISLTRAMRGLGATEP